MDKVPDIDVLLAPSSKFQINTSRLIDVYLKKIIFNIRTYFILSQQTRGNSSNLAIQIQNPQIEENVFPYHSWMYGLPSIVFIFFLRD